MDENMPRTKIRIDMDAYQIPLSEVIEGGLYEVRFGTADANWHLGMRYGKVWLANGDVVGRLSETTHVRLPEFRVLESVKGIAKEWARGIAEKWLPHDEQGSFKKKLRIECHYLIAAKNDSVEIDDALFSRIRKAFLCDVMAVAEPSKPLSEIIAGYVVVNTADATEYETDVLEDAHDFLEEHPESSNWAVGILFADGSISYDSERPLR